MKIEIKCPKCSWKPTSEKLWQCTCNHIWNTFDTCAQCPKCKKIWEETSCPKCQRWLSIWHGIVTWMIYFPKS